MLSLTALQFRSENRGGIQRVDAVPSDPQGLPVLLMDDERVELLEELIG